MNMKKLSFLMVLLMIGFVATSCDKDDDKEDVVDPDFEYVECNGKWFFNVNDFAHISNLHSDEANAIYDKLSARTEKVLGKTFMFGVTDNKAKAYRYVKDFITKLKKDKETYSYLKYFLQLRDENGLNDVNYMVFIIYNNETGHEIANIAISEKDL